VPKFNSGKLRITGRVKSNRGTLRGSIRSSNQRPRRSRKCSERRRTRTREVGEAIGSGGKSSQCGKFGIDGKRAGSKRQARTYADLFCGTRASRGAPEKTGGSHGEDVFRIPVRRLDKGAIRAVCLARSECVLE
jgi:hypothetical protein